MGTVSVPDSAIRYTGFLAADGSLAGPLPPNLTEPDIQLDLYCQMVRARAFDAQAIALQRTGRLGTYASSLGQEAVGVGIGYAMAPDDVLLPSFRDHPAQLGRGVRPEELLLYWGGDERGSDFAGPRQDFPVSITVGGHAPHAAGVALAFKLRGEARAAVCLFGDGATSKGDVYEAMNVAGLWQLPVVFVVSNNQWAISTPRREQTAARTLAQKAIATGFNGEQVDGNDVLAVAHVMGAAIDKARTGGGPGLVECLTYRLADHTTADDASRYRDSAEVERAWEKDPLQRLRRHLIGTDAWDDVRDAALEDECRAEMAAARDAYLRQPARPPESIFDHTYATLPADLVHQRELLLRSGTADSDG